MTDYDWTQCSDCGWTGRTSELDGENDRQTCPACGAEVAIE